MQGTRRDGTLVSIGQAAEMLGVSVPTLRRWSASGRIASQLTTGGHRRFTVDEVRRLRDAANGNTAPSLRTPALPEGSLPSMAGLLQARGNVIATASARHLYSVGSTGWFSASSSEPLVEEWLRDVGMGCRAGTYTTAVASTVELAHQALCGSHGATLRECVFFLEIFGTMITRELGPAHMEAPEARRLFSLLRYAPLDLADGSALTLARPTPAHAAA
jgi:excisionase family DNA binding protein